MWLVFPEDTYNIDFHKMAVESGKIPQLLQLSATIVKLYVIGVYRKNEPHGQVRNYVDMDCVLLARANSSKEAAVKGVQMEVNRRVPR